MKIRQQKELSESVVAKIQKELENPKILQQILQQSIQDVESMQPSLSIDLVSANHVCRDCSVKGTIDQDKGSARYRFLLSPFVVYKLPLCHSRKQFLLLTLSDDSHSYGDLCLFDQKPASQPRDTNSLMLLLLLSILGSVG